MKSLLHQRILLLFVMTFSLVVLAEEDATENATAIPTITARDAIDYVGQTGTVCGVVASARYLHESERKLTLLNIDEAYPNQVFDVVIENADRAGFAEPPEKFYRGKKVCVTGLIERFKEKGQIRVTDPGQIVVTESPEAP